MSLREGVIESLERSNPPNCHEPPLFGESNPLHCAVKFKISSGSHGDTELLLSLPLPPPPPTAAPPHSGLRDANREAAVKPFPGKAMGSERGIGP